MEVKEIQKHLFDLAEKAKDSKTTEALKETCKRFNIFLPMQPKDVQSFLYSPETEFKFRIGTCPTCGATCVSDMKHCDNCGQELDWTNAN